MMERSDPDRASGISRRVPPTGEQTTLHRSETMALLWRGILLRLCLGLAVLLQGCPGRSHAAQTFHDPSTIIECKGGYWLFSTGMGVKSWRSKDLTHWEPGPRVLQMLPPWINGIVPGHKGYFWAPDCILLHDRYLLYYSVSGWGKNASAIGLASNPTLDPADPAYHWTDEGIVVQSSTHDSFNAIDPSLVLDPTGRLWMAFGSFWGGIKLVELDPVSGRRMGSDSKMYSLAYHKEIEAPCLVSHGGSFYLFVDWGLCCRGTNSTYELRVGRSEQVTGPYLDRDGVDMRVNGGGSFLGNEGTRIGPGHAGVLRAGGYEWLSYHFYDATNGGVATLGLRRLEWDTTGWPVPGKIVVP